MTEIGEKIRKCSTDELLRIAQNSEDEGYNRLLSQDEKDALDKNGIHILEFQILHAHRHGEECEPHVRTVALLKLDDDMEPHFTTLDMNTEDWLDLDETGEVMDGEDEADETA